MLQEQVEFLKRINPSYLQFVLISDFAVLRIEGLTRKAEITERKQKQLLLTGYLSWVETDIDWYAQVYNEVFKECVLDVKDL